VGGIGADLARWGGMSGVMAWAAFLGAWLLVAGPLYQGAMELHEADVDREAIEATKNQVPRPDNPSAWWWLLPPVMYLLWRRRSDRYRQATLAALTPVQREQFTSFVNKANGWFIVACGATLLAADETWQLAEHEHWPDWVFWVLAAGTLVLSIGNTTAHMIYDARQEAKMGT